MGSERRFPLTLTSVMRSQPIGAEDKPLRRNGNCKHHWAVRKGGVEVWEHTESCGLKLVGKEEQGETRCQRATLRVQRSQHSSVHLTPRPYAKTTMTWFTKENDVSGCVAENTTGPRVETRWIGRLCEIAVAWIWRCGVGRKKWIHSWSSSYSAECCGHGNAWSMCLDVCSRLQEQCCILSFYMFFSLLLQSAPCDLL